jgi:uncharacterized protein YbjT (DUF2867 family)
VAFRHVAASIREPSAQRSILCGAYCTRRARRAQEALSAHLASRLAVGRALREGTVPCLELRASVIVGNGSASFRILRDLAARLPAMVLPRWLENRTEPWRSTT